jgi:5'-nucleotidase/UDP-sugar diphosphatase
MNTALRRSSLALLLVLAFSAMLFAGGTTITILHVNDTHSHLDAFGPKDLHLNGTVGGLAKAATVIGMIKATTPNVVLLHAGDIFHGDLFYNYQPPASGGQPELGVPELMLMGQMGFDAMAVGNHELEGGPDALMGVLGATNPPFPLLSANMDLSDYVGLKNWIQASIIKDVGGVKLGIFGMIVPNEPTEQTQGLYGSVTISDDVFNIAGEQAALLRYHGAEVVICLSHLGSQYDKAVAANVPGIDVIVGGHDHYLFEHPLAIPNPGGTKTLVLQAGEFYEHVGKLTIEVEHHAMKLKDYRIISVDWKIPPVPQIQAVVNDLKKGIVERYGDMYHKVVGIAIHDLDKLYDAESPLRDTPLGNLVTDACRKKGGTDIAIAANGFISEKIYGGMIVGADVFRAMSYGFDPATGLEFKLARIKMTGMNLVAGLETVLSFLGLSDDIFLQVSGLTYKYDATKPVGGRVLLPSIRINGRPLNPYAEYTITVNEGILALLPLLQINATFMDAMPDLEYNVVRDYIRKLGIVWYFAEGRIRDVSVPCRPGLDPADAQVLAENTEKSEPQVVQEYQLSQNYPNPFNPSTTITYSLAKNSHVTLKIYNSLGQEIATLVNEEEPAGQHQAIWNAANVASGVYFYRMMAGNFVDTKKLSVVK